MGEPWTMLWSSEALPFSTKPNFKKSAFSLVSVAQFLSLSSHILRYELPHGICRLLLHFGSDVRVSAERETSIEVAQHTGDSLDVPAVLQGYHITSTE